MLKTIADRVAVVAVTMNHQTAKQLDKRIQLIDYIHVARHSGEFNKISHGLIFKSLAAKNWQHNFMTKTH